MLPHSLSSQRGLIRSAMLLLLVLAVGIGVGWWWFVGRYALPDKAPARAESVEPVLDYVERSELGTDPLENMVKPSLSDATKGGVESKLHLKNWGEAYLKASAARVAWKTAAAAGSLVDGISSEKYHLDYLHEAQLAEYYRARYLNALESR
jgi:hypothetical protein